MKQLWVPVLLAVMLGACSSKGFKKPTAKERAVEVSQIQTQLAVEYMRAKDYRLATASIEEALKANSKNEMAWLIRAQIYQFLKVPERAEESFLQGLSIKPDSAEINNNYGWFLCSVKNNPNAALPYFDRALADPTYPSPFIAYLNKGVCSAKMGQYSLAQAYLERSIAAAPNFVPAVKELARTKLLAGELNEADVYFRQYQSRVEMLSADDLLLGWKLAKALGNGQAAYEYEAQLRALYPYSDELQSIAGGGTQ
ncbi:type IV pilus biogenesis/stability protein PilW [Neisseria canis]|uniref:Lipoprotein n=1 Tax=Neisseria canis TaxID=493 RepID=A0A448D952_9NEIS|nr:type IV pilus biogenesis/stability protein PilW [Neisseria canis]OSI12882.1 type IV pilus biogenesis/stability protein PilW [Neisseria canis]VEF02062.1 lipoprotein [Neisseria canis]